MKGRNTITRVLLVLLISVVCVIFGMCIPSVAKETRVTITEYKNEIIGDDDGGIIDFTDPETGVCYFIYKDGYHGMGQGGMTVRYNADGTIMVRDVSGVKVKNDAK